MAEAKTEETQRQKEMEFRLIPYERLQEILNILFPYGYSHYDGTKYTGVSPFIGTTQNIITVVANDTHWSDGVFSICMDRFSDDENEDNSLGFYKGIMKVIAPELYSYDKKFKEHFNVLDFYWAGESVQANAFPVGVLYKPF